MVWPAGEAAFVTGGASGIGLGITRALVAAGAKVAVADLDETRLADVTDELTAGGATVTAVRLDVSDEHGWTAAADAAEEAVGPISILVNNAGVNGGGAIEDTSYQVWRWVNAVNLDGQFLGTRTFLPRFKRRGGRAHILNTASAAGLVPMANVGAYTASKFASIGFTKVLRQELGGTDIGVSVLLPGTVATRISRTGAAGEAALTGREVDQRAVEANQALLAEGADPDAVGRQVVEAMQARDFAIVTHREWGELLRRENAEMQAAYDDFDGRHGPDLTARMLLTGTQPVTA